MHFPHRRHTLHLVGACVLLSLVVLAAPKIARADAAWPTRPITFVVPGAAGGTTDTPVRFMAQKPSERLGQPIIVDNKPGAGGALGSNLVAHAQPDGYTVLVGNTGSNAINYTAYPKLSYKAEDFTPLTDMISFANVLVVPVKSSIKSLKDLVSTAKREPGKLAFSSAGAGQTTHLMGELLRQSAGGCGPRALQGLRTCHHGHSGGRDPVHVRQPHRFAGACQGWQAACPGCDGGHA